MGACVSVSTVVSSSDDKNDNYAKVITSKGHILQYPAAAGVSASVSQVLVDGDENDDTDQNSNKMFVCDSDTLYYNHYIPALKSHACLQPNHMYFILPVTLLQTPLSANDMASLAVKAAQALPISTTTTTSTTTNKKIKKLLQHLNIISHRISPHEGEGESDGDNSSSTTTIKTFSPSLISSGNNSSSSSSVKRRLSRYSSSTRGKSAVRSFRLTLNTIYEGIIL